MNSRLELNFHKYSGEVLTVKDYLLSFIKENNIVEVDKLNKYIEVFEEIPQLNGGIKYRSVLFWKYKNIIEVNLFKDKIKKDNFRIIRERSKVIHI